MKLIDLSHALSNKTPTYPTDPDISIVRLKEIQKHNSVLHYIKMGTHTGTHLDAPSHIIPDGKTLSNVSLNRFTGTAIKLDSDTYKDFDFTIRPLDGIIFDLNWYKNFHEPKIFFSPNRPNIPKDLFNYINDLELKFFGCDLPSIDKSGSKEKPIHNMLLGKDIIIYESLTNLDMLPLGKPFQFFGFPLPFEGLDGSPVRAVAACE